MKGNKKIAFHTLGCKVNSYETESIWNLFSKEGYTRIENLEEADVCIINTCTVTNNSDKKSRQSIRKIIRKNPDSVICVTGCYAQVKSNEVMDIEGVDVVVGTQGRENIVELVEKYIEDRIPTNSVANIMRTKNYEEIFR